MNLRKELEIPEVSAETIAELKRLAVEIEEGLTRKQDVNDKIARFKQMTGKEYQPYDFVGYYGSMSLDEFVRKAAMSSPRRIADITKQELVEVVQRILRQQQLLEYDSDLYSAIEDEYYCKVVEVNTRHPHVRNLIYEGMTKGLGPEDLVEQALSWTPSLQLPPP